MDQDNVPLILRKLDEKEPGTPRLGLDEKEPETPRLALDEKEPETPQLAPNEKPREVRQSQRNRKRPQLFGTFASPESVEKLRSTSISLPTTPETNGIKRKRESSKKSKPKSKRARKEKMEEEEEVISSRSESFLALKKNKKKKKDETNEKKDELDEKHVDQKDDKSEKKSKPKGSDKKEDQKQKGMMVPLVRPTSLKPGTICARMMMGRITKTDALEDKLYYHPIRDNDNSAEWWIRSSSAIEMASTTRYQRTIELSKTDMAKQLMECAIFPMRVSFRPVVNLESLGEQMKQYREEFKEEKMTDKDFKQLIKKVIHVPERTMDCILLEKNTALGYSLVDDLSGPAGPGKKVFKTISHSDIQQIVFLETRYRLKGTKFEDPELEYVGFC